MNEQPESAGHPTSNSPLRIARAKAVYALLQDHDGTAAFHTLLRWLMPHPPSAIHPAWTRGELEESINDLVKVGHAWIEVHAGDLVIRTLEPQEDA